MRTEFCRRTTSCEFLESRRSLIVSNCRFAFFMPRVYSSLVSRHHPAIVSTCRSISASLRLRFFHPPRWPLTRPRRIHHLPEGETRSAGTQHMSLVRETHSCCFGSTSTLASKNQTGNLAQKDVSRLAAAYWRETTGNQETDIQGHGEQRGERSTRPKYPSYSYKYNDALNLLREPGSTLNQLNKSTELKFGAAVLTDGMPTPFGCDYSLIADWQFGRRTTMICLALEERKIWSERM